MRIPADDRERENFVREVLDQCLVSVGARRSRYAELRKWVLYGGTGSVAPRFNKIFPTIDQLTAFTFAAESVRFAIELDEDEGSEQKVDTGDYTERADILSQDLRNYWRRGQGDLVFGQSVFWAFGYGLVPIKMIWEGGCMRYYLVQPGNFGVMREDSPFLEDQEAVVECYCIGKSQLERILRSDPKRDPAAVAKFLADVPVVGGDKTEPEEENFVGRLVISQSQPTMVGSVADLQNWSSNLVPQVKEDLVEMHELRIWDDDIDDYRIFTIAAGDICIFDRPNSEFFVKGELCYSGVCPGPIYNYAWGKSEVEPLIPLQLWREERMKQIDGLWQRQLKPPRFASGMMGLTDEKIAALYRPGGMIGEQNPGAKIETLQPTMPVDMFAEIREIDAMFDYTVGLPPITQGRGEPGVRAGDQADSLARMPAARMRKRSLAVEASLERIGDLTFRMMQRESRRIYHTEAGTAFSAAQFPERFSVTVAAHTSSPLFAQDLKDDAQLMFKEGVIDGDTLLELLDPPRVQTLQARLRRRQKAQADEQAQEQKMLTDAIGQLGPEDRANFLTRLIGAIKGKGKP